MNKLNRNWKIHLIHHTHVDIGYTHPQDEVLALQIRNLEKAMDLIDANQSREAGNRFKWNPEITWVLSEWLKIADDESIKRFVEDVKTGSIGLDGLFGNLLTGLCRPEEMMANFQGKETLEKLTGTRIDSAMITDVPGWNWGFVTALVENGIRYLSIGTNRSDRIGHILKRWADKPFYWESPSGEKILAFIHGKGYSWFHSGLNQSKNLSKKLNPSRICSYLKKLEKTNYSYDTILIRYNIGADNGPPDENLCDIIEKWNHEYPQMQMILSTTSEAMKDFEKQYGMSLPTYRGDLTPYWEDGAASTARETAIARRGAEQLIQLDTLSSLFGKEPQSDKQWQDILLFDEHTWGAYNSISKPDHAFAKSQWEWKKQHAYAGYDGGAALRDQLLPQTTDQVITVYNTHSWNLSQTLKIQTTCDSICDEQGNHVLTQRLSDGRLAFFAMDVPALSSKQYHLSNSQEMATNGDMNTLESNNLKVSLNLETGLIDSIRYKEREFVKSSRKEKFNQFVFASGKWGTRRIVHKPKNISISLLEKGPLLSTVKVTYEAYGMINITSLITVSSQNDLLTIENILNRPVSRKKEGLHFEFPFDLDQGRIKYDVIYGSAVVDKDQLEGSNKNFITATRWFDVSNKEDGVSCVLLDAPIIKAGHLVHDPFRSGNPDLCGWKRETHYNGTVYSYVMNNYWMTNYKADQPGVTSFKYVFRPHSKFDESETHKLALEVSQPLMVGYTDMRIEPLLQLDNEKIICTSIKQSEQHLFFRLWNPSDRKQCTKITSYSDYQLEVVSPDKAGHLCNQRVTLNASETICMKAMNRVPDSKKVSLTGKF